MLHKHSRSLALLLGLCAACGGDDDVDNPDGGTKSDASIADAGRLDAGGLDGSTSTGDVLVTGKYTVSKVVKISDSCGLELEDGTFKELDLFNNGGTTISVGTKYTATTDPSWTPEGYALGTGPWITARTTTLTAMSKVKFSENNITCEFNVQRTTSLAYTGPNTVEVDFTDNESGPSAGCAQLDGPTGSCTSRYTFTLSPPVTLPDGGTVK